MIRRLRQLWKVRPVLTFAFLLACAITLFFAGTTAWRAVYWSMNQEQPVAPWMTVGYIARSWDLDPRQIDGLTGLPMPPEKGHPQTLAEVARDRGVPVETIIADVEATIATLRAAAPGHSDLDGANP